MSVTPTAAELICSCLHVAPKLVVRSTPLLSPAKHVELEGQVMVVIPPVLDGSVVSFQIAPESVVTSTSPACELLLPEA
jgi:hypothetical protein